MEHEKYLYWSPMNRRATNIVDKLTSTAQLVQSSLLNDPVLVPTTSERGLLQRNTGNEWTSVRTELPHPIEDNVDHDDEEKINPTRRYNTTSSFATNHRILKLPWGGRSLHFTPVSNTNWVTRSRQTCAWGREP